jgi:hypothetical protein
MSLMLIEFLKDAENIDYFDNSSLKDNYKNKSPMLLIDGTSDRNLR